MSFRFTFVTSWSLGLLIVALALHFVGQEGMGYVRAFCLIVGMLGWHIGNKQIELEDRLETLEKVSSPVDTAAQVESNVVRSPLAPR
jgi:hypothetical protein